VVRRLGPDAADDIVAETFLLAFGRSRAPAPTR
jgi:DNA-directed RNA polymerase specialized sigma24 family protein